MSNVKECVASERSHLSQLWLSLKIVSFLIIAEASWQNNCCMDLNVDQFELIGYPEGVSAV